MKQTILFVVALIQAGCTLANPATTKFAVKVTDAETGLPILNAVAKVDFILKYDPWGAKKNEYDQKTISVNADGIAVIEGETIRRTGGGASVFADGYYSDGDGFPFSGRNVILNRWEPWNPVIEVKMRPKKNLVPMAHYSHGGSWMPMPENKRVFGFDLEQGDWVSPYGKGKISDFIFHPYRTDTDKEIRYGYKLSFSNPLDGIQEFRPPEVLRSSYIFPYLAPTNGYISTLEKIKIDPFRGPVETDMNKQNNYIFRVRSYKDENGNIGGSYGRIKGEIIMSGQFGLQFNYHFNPVPNERSLEYSDENLLKK